MDARLAESVNELHIRPGRGVVFGGWQDFPHRFTDFGSIDLKPDVRLLVRRRGINQRSGEFHFPSGDPASGNLHLLDPDVDRFDAAGAVHQHQRHTGGIIFG